MAKIAGISPILKRVPTSLARSRLGLALACLLSLHAVGAQATKGFTPLEGLENWEGSIDLSTYAPGKYNLLVEGRDAAGNLTTAGPINVFIDPASDLPRVSIVNPFPGQRVGGALNIVGTCSDDDGVASVELSIDGGAWQPATGGEFWSLYLGSLPVEDGRRQLQVRGIDVNGLAGPPTTVLFDLDRNKPVARVEFPAAGALVAGELKISGSVSDRNGVASLEISADGMKTWIPVKLGKTRTKEELAFSWSMDSRKREDGPFIVWFRSVDGVGSSSVTAHLVLIDNTKPVIELLRPSPEAGVHGLITIAGAARDAIGLESLTWQLAGIGQGEIALTKGDPYFVQDLDLGGVKGGSVELILTARDAIGNQTLLKRQLKIDRQADLPLVTVTWPQPGTILQATDLVYGAVADDDGVAALRYSLNGAAPREVPAAEAFTLALPPGLPSGKNILSITAVDSNGLAGPASTVEFLLDRGPGSIVFERLSSAKASREFQPGIEVRVDGGESLEGSIFAPNPLLSAELSLAGGQPRKLELQKGGASDRYLQSLFRIPLDRSLPYGVLPVEVKATDIYGRSYRGQTLVYVLNYGRIREETGFRFLDPRLEGNGRFVFGMDSTGSQAPFRGAFYGEELESLAFDPPSELVTAGFQGMVVSIEALKDGSSPPLSLVGRTTRGHEFRAGPFSFVTDARQPELELVPPAAGAFLAGELRLEGRVADEGGLSSLSWRRLPDGPAAEILPAASGSFSRTLPAAELPAGPLSLELLATDKAGNQARRVLSLFIDNEAPRLRFLAPEEGAVVSGPEDVAALLEDGSGVALVEFAEDGRSFQPLDFQAGFFIHRTDFAALPEAAYRVTDRAGNRVTARPAVSAGAAPPSLARAAISVEPAAGEPRLELSGAAGGRALSLLLPAVSDTAFAELGLGDPAAPVPERFRPLLLVAGSLSLKGQVIAEQPLKALSLSADSGATWLPLAAWKEQAKALPSLAFSLARDFSKTPSGEQRLLLKTEDWNGASFFTPLFILLDNELPSLSVISPTGAAPLAAGPAPLVLKLGDAQGLASLELTLGLAKESLDLSTGGSYVVRLLDPSQPKASPLALSALLRDRAGNQSQAALKLGYDAAADLPRLLPPPAAAEPLRAGAVLSGGASDDDGPPLLKLSLDGGELREFPAGAFSLVLPRLTEGKHSLLLVAEDRNGKRTELKHEFSARGPAPEILGLELGDAKARQPWSPGLAVATGEGAILAGTIRAPSGLAAVELSINGGPPVKASLGKPSLPGEPLPFSAPLPAGLPWDRVSFTLQASDPAGQVARFAGEYHRILPSAAGAEDAEGIRFQDQRIGPQVDAASAASSAPAAAGAGEGTTPVYLVPGATLDGYWNGRPLASVRLDPPLPGLSLSHEGAFLQLGVTGESLFAPTSIEVLTVDGDRSRWGPFGIVADEEPPRIELTAPVEGQWAQRSVRLTGTARDANGISRIEARAQGGAAVQVWPSAGVKAGAPEATIDAELPIVAAPDGMVSIEVLVWDGAGKATRLARGISKDTLAPSLSQVIPAPGETVNGRTTVAVEVKDSGRIESASFLPGAGAGPEEVKGLGLVSRSLDFARLALPLGEGGGFSLRDRAGNQALLAPELLIDTEKDAPVAQVQAPLEDEVLRQEFVIAGVAYDDDGVAAVHYRIDGAAWTRLPVSGTSFAVPVSLAETTDNEHLVEAFAEDIYGVRGPTSTRKYRISKEEPAARMSSPSLERPVRGAVTVGGEASDANGVAEVEVSVDNRLSFKFLDGAETWRYALETGALQDGLHAVAVRPVDRYGTEGFYASIVTVDNTPPRSTLDLPADGALVGRELVVSGRIADAVGLAEARLEIHALGAARPALTIPLPVTPIVRKVVDLSALSPGAYSVRLVARDRADNESLASRDIVFRGVEPRDLVEIVHPAEGSSVSGLLRVNGRALLEGGAATVTLSSKGTGLGVAKIDERGWWSLEVPTELLGEGRLELQARAATAEGRIVDSKVNRVLWQAFGPWISLDSRPAGSWMPYRPWIEGRAGWAAPLPDPADKAAADAARKLAKEREVVLVELSLDEGKTWTEASGTANWKWRLETIEAPEGALILLARATCRDGSVAWTRSSFYLDKTPPEVAIDQPRENGRYNGSLALAGTARDGAAANGTAAYGYGLSSVAVSLRKGDKKSYELPAFVQGLYVDAHVFGATTWETGLGLTFFDDNVKLQGLYGQAPAKDDSGVAASFYGPAFGAKLIANLAYLPFNVLFGPDWDFLSLSLGLGANFTYFSETQAGQGLLVGGVFGQLEFPKFRIASWKAFKTYSFYTEFQVWVLSSVVSGGFIPRMSFGTRIGVF